VVTAAPTFLLGAAVAWDIRSSARHRRPRSCRRVAVRPGGRSAPAAAVARWRARARALLSMRTSMASSLHWRVSSAHNGGRATAVSLVLGKTPFLYPGRQYKRAAELDLRRDDATRDGGEVARLFNLSPSLIGETLQVNRSTARTEFEEAHRPASSRSRRRSPSSSPASSSPGISVPGVIGSRSAWMNGCAGPGAAWPMPPAS
jgi:hypothetical protein